MTILLACFLSFTQAAIANHSHEKTLSEILENQAHCVQSIDHERIYLSVDNLYMIDHRHFVDVNGNDLIPVDNLVFDDQGYWIPSTSKKIEVLNICPHCGRRYFVRCRNPNCSSNQR